MGKTNAGKAMLEADFQMKRTEGRLLNPDTATGAEFWREMDQAGFTCSLSRSWIVPGQVEVREDGDSLYILKASLDVKTAPISLPNDDPDACPEQSPTSTARKNAIETRLILPKVVKAVNTAPEYAPVRRAFTARIVAQWIRDRHAEGKATSFDQVLDSGNLGPAQLTGDWKPKQVWDDYVKSLRGKEFTYEKTTREGNQLVRHQYVTGGVDLTNLKISSISAADMKARYSGLPGTVTTSINAPATAADGTIWLGATATLPDRGVLHNLSTRARDVTSSRAGVLLIVVVALAILLLGFRSGSRRRPRSRLPSKSV
jgi:hypothetical protein